MQSISSSVGSVTEGVGVVTQGVRAGIVAIMNLAAQGGADTTTGKKLFSVSFNQDFTSLGVGTKAGYKLFTISNAEKIEQLCDNANEDTFIVERLFSSSLVAVVSLSAPRKLKVCHFKKNSEICNYSYPNTILAVKLNRVRLVVCLEESLYIHNIRDMKVLHTIRDTPQNNSGLCALSVSNDNCYLAYPGSNTMGQVQIFDATNLQAKTIIPAHDSPLAALSFNATGTKIATASEKGTVIRVFSVVDGTRLNELRRGIKRCASIYSLSFSPDSVFLIASSNTETVHIFKLHEIKDTERVMLDEQQSLMGMMAKAVTMTANYLPGPVTDILSQGRSFATITLPYYGIRSVCAVTYVNKQPRVIIASEQAMIYFYTINTVEGGECALVKQHILESVGDGGTSIDGSNNTPSLTSNTPVYPGGAKKSEPEPENIASAMPVIVDDCLSDGVVNLDDEAELPPV